jgi:hypothetical protein
MFTLARCIGGAVMRANIREIFTSATTVGCVIVLGAAATAIAGTLLWIPYTRKRVADRIEQRAAAVAEAAKFETLYWDEYDALLASTAATATTATAVTEYSPQGDAVTMVYLPDRIAFGYYTDRKNGISYPQLETVARKYLVDNAQRDTAKQAYADRRSKTATATATTQDSDVVDLGLEPNNTATAAATPAAATPAAAAAAATSGTASSTGGGIFAMFRRYNRKPASASTAPNASADKAEEAPLEYTRFVYLGSMHDYEIKNKNKRSSESSSSSSSSASDSTSDCDAAIDYAEFKRLKFENGIRSGERLK